MIVTMKLSKYSYSIVFAMYTMESYNYTDSQYDITNIIENPAKRLHLCSNEDLNRTYENSYDQVFESWAKLYMAQHNMGNNIASSISLKASSIICREYVTQPHDSSENLQSPETSRAIMHSHLSFFFLFSWNICDRILDVGTSARRWQMTSDGKWTTVKYLRYAAVLTLVYLSG